MTETSSLRYSTSTFSTLCSISLGSSTFCSSTPPSSRGSYSLLSDRIHQIDQRQTQASSWRIHIRLSQGEFIYVYHKERSNGNIAWRCHQYSQPANTRCSAAAVTTGTSSSSTLKYARDHNHPPSAGRVGVYKVKNNLKTVSSQDRTAKPHKIVLDNLRNVTELTNNWLHEDTSLKKTVQRQRKRDNLAANPDLTQACDRRLILLQIPPTLLSAWKVFDSGPSSTRVITLTTEPNREFLCQSMRWCGDGTFKAAPGLFTQLHTIHGQKSGYTVPCVYALLPSG